MNIFDILIQQPIINALVAIFHALNAVNIPFTLGFSIIVLTIAIRLLLYPLTAQQLKVSKKMQEMAPHLSKIKEKHKGDMKGQQEAQMALYKEHGINPLAGCLPALVQLPLLFGLYGVLQKAVQFKSPEEVNKLLYSDSLKLKELWDTNFFGLPLGQTPAQLLPKVGAAILLVAVVTGLLQFIQSKMTMPAKSSTPKVPAKKETKGMDFASAFQTQTLYILPVMIGFFSYGFPIGLSLYWNTFTVFGIIQQYRIGGLGGLRGMFNKTDNK